MTTTEPRLPLARGPISAHVIAALRDPARKLAPARIRDVADVLRDDDLQLALYTCYELSYRGFAGVDPEWEWEPSLLALRGQLERVFERALIDRLGRPDQVAAGSQMDLELRAIIDADDAPSVSKFIEREATLDQVREFLIHRSAYQLKEADPHSWALPRLWGRPKAAMIEIQADEYGGGRADRIHAQLFADSMDALGLESAYGAYLDQIPGVTLATVNLMSFMGLHRRWRGGIVGHLAVFEMTSSIPNRRYGTGLRRLGLDGAAIEFFDEHVLADAVHENVAAVDLAGGLVAQDPALAGSVLWGARALILLDALWAWHLLGAWQAGHSSLAESTHAAELVA